MSGAHVGRCTSGTRKLRGDWGIVVGWPWTPSPFLQPGWILKWPYPWPAAPLPDGQETEEKVAGQTPPWICPHGIWIFTWLLCQALGLVQVSRSRGSEAVWPLDLIPLRLWQRVLLQLTPHFFSFALGQTLTWGSELTAYCARSRRMLQRCRNGGTEYSWLGGFVWVWGVLCNGGFYCQQERLPGLTPAFSLYLLCNCLLLSVCMIPHNQPEVLSREECTTVFEKRQEISVEWSWALAVDLISYSMWLGSALSRNFIHVQVPMS